MGVQSHCVTSDVNTGINLVSIAAFRICVNHPVTKRKLSFYQFFVVVTITHKKIHVTYMDQNHTHARVQTSTHVQTHTHTQRYTHTHSHYITHNKNIAHCYHKFLCICLAVGQATQILIYISKCTAVTIHHTCNIASK